MSDHIKSITKVLSILNKTHKFSTLEILRKLSITAANSDITEQELAEQLEEFTDNLRRIDNLLYCYELYLDRQLPILQGQLESMITDRISALKAIDQFNIAYFRNIPMSLNAKQSLAGTLINLTRRYANSDNNFWVSLQNGNSDVLNKVIFQIDEVFLN